MCIPKLSGIAFQTIWFWTLYFKCVQSLFPAPFQLRFTTCNRSSRLLYCKCIQMHFTSFRCNFKRVWHVSKSEALTTLETVAFQVHSTGMPADILHAAIYIYMYYLMVLQLNFFKMQMECALNAKTFLECAWIAFWNKHGMENNSRMCLLEDQDFAAL